MTSWMAPRVQRTSFASLTGGTWKCIPRSVPFRRFQDTLHWATSGSRRSASNSRRQKLRAKKPRSSSRRSSSTTYAPASGVSANFTPEEILVELLRLHEVTDLLETRVRARLEQLDRHADPLEDFEQLLGALPHVPARGESGETARDLVEVDLVVALVAAAVPERHRATGECLAHDRCDVAHLVVLSVGPDVEGLVVYDVARRFEHAGSRLRNVEDMHERPPRRPVGVHPDLLVAPGQSREVVDDQIEALSGRCPICRRVPQVRRGKIVAGHGREVALDQELAFGVRRERLGAAAFVLRGIRTRAVYAAGAEVHEARHAHLARETRQADGALVIDLVGDVRRELPDRIVAELGEVDDRIVSAKIVRRDVPDILDQDLRRGMHAVIEPADPVESGVAASDIVPAVEQILTEDGADVPVASGDEDLRHRSAAEGPERSLAVEETDVLRLGCGEAPHGPGEMHEVRLVRRHQRMHPALGRQAVAFPRIAAAAAGHPDRPLVSAAPRDGHHVVPGQAFARPELDLPAVTILAPVAVASEEEGVGDLAAETAGNVNELDEADDRGFGQSEAFTSYYVALFRLHDLGFPLNDKS